MKILLIMIILDERHSSITSTKMHSMEVCKEISAELQSSLNSRGYTTIFRCSKDIF